MRVFTSLLSPDEALARYRARLALVPVEPESISLLEALGRVLAEPATAGGDLPPFDRSTVDGYAVRAADVAAASEAAPARLDLAGEVRMGEAPDRPLAPGEAVRVPTGGALPDGADAVVMQEHVEVASGAVVVRRILRPGENVLARAEDVRAGETVLAAGRRLRPQDLGLLAGLGVGRVRVRRRPLVALFSTGDELVAPDQAPAPGQVRDMNAYALAGLVQVAGGASRVHPILPDDLAVVTDALRTAVGEHDLVLVSGGSSVGERDVVVEAIAALGPPGIIVHGIAVKPGKPTVLAVAGRTPVIGLPGNPVSAMVIFALFARPLIEELLGMTEPDRPVRVRARAARALPGAGEREEHVRVRLDARAGDLWAHPLAGKSGVLTSMVRADGIVVVKPHTRVDEGTEVEVTLLA